MIYLEEIKKENKLPRTDLISQQKFERPLRHRISLDILSNFFNLIIYLKKGE